MKHPSVRLSLLVTLAALAVAGCAVGSTADLGTDVAGTSPREADAAGPSSLASDAGMPTGETDGADAANAADAATAADAAEAATDAAIDPVAPASCAFTGPLVTFDLSSAVGTQADLAAAATGPGITSSHLARASVAAVSASGAMNSSGWPVGGVDRSRYYVFRVTPPAGCALTLGSITFDPKASPTGPTSAAVGTDIDGFVTLASTTVTTTGGATTVPLGGASAGAGSTVEVHVYGFGASAVTGTMRLQNTLSLTGSL